MAGGEELFIIGKNFTSKANTEVKLRQLDDSGKMTWEGNCEIDKALFQNVSSILYDFFSSLISVMFLKYFCHKVFYVASRLEHFVNHILLYFDLQNHIVCKIPPYPNQNLRTPATVYLVVTGKPNQCSDLDAHPIVYQPKIGKRHHFEVP